MEISALNTQGKVELPPAKTRATRKDAGKPRKKEPVRSAASSLIDVLAALDGQPIEAQERILKTALVYCGLDGKGPL